MSFPASSLWIRCRVILKARPSGVVTEGVSWHHGLHDLFGLLVFSSFTSKKQTPLKPIAAVIAGALVSYIVLQTLAGNSLSVLESSAMAVLQLGIVAVIFAPFMYFSFRKAAKQLKNFSVQRSLGFLGLSALVYLGYALIVTAPRLEWFADLQLNWQGKILALIAAIVLILLWRGLSWKGIGFTKPKPGTWWRLGVTSLAIVLVWVVIAGAPETPSLMPNTETILSFRQ